MDFKDYYSTLGVAKTASQKDIKQAFRRLARRHHPDVNPNNRSAEAKFKEINEAYEVLGDPTKRKKYDELGANWRMYEQTGAAGSRFRGAERGGAWNVHSGGGPGTGSRSMTEEEMRELLGNTDPFSDFFHTFFGGAASSVEDARRRGPGARAPATPQGRDVEHEIEIRLEDAYQGTTRRLSVKHDGHARAVEVRIPSGVGDGSRVRVSGEGQHGTGGARSGDLYLRIRLAPHAKFQRKGKDLYTRVPVPLTTVVLGGEADVMTLGGKSLRLKIPPTTQNAQVFRLKGYGMPEVGKPHQLGVLYATLDVELPGDLTPEQRAHFEALRQLEKGTKNSAAQRRT